MNKRPKAKEPQYSTDSAIEAAWQQIARQVLCKEEPCLSCQAIAAQWNGKADPMTIRQLRVLAHEEGHLLMQMMQPPKLLVTVQEAAERLSMSRAKLYTLLMRQEIRNIKVDGKRLIPVAALEQYIKEQLGDEEETSEIDRNRRIPPKRRALHGAPAAG